MKYTVRFFTRDIVNGEWDDEHELSRIRCDWYIPVPKVGSIICLEDQAPNIYRCKEVEYCYPTGSDLSEGFEVDVIVEVEK